MGGLSPLTAPKFVIPAEAGIQDGALPGCRDAMFVLREPQDEPTWGGPSSQEALRRPGFPGFRPAPERRWGRPLSSSFRRRPESRTEHCRVEGMPSSPFESLRTNRLGAALGHCGPVLGLGFLGSGLRRNDGGVGPLGTPPAKPTSLYIPPLYSRPHISPSPQPSPSRGEGALPVPLCRSPSPQPSPSRGDGVARPSGARALCGAGKRAQNRHTNQHHKHTSDTGFAYVVRLGRP